MKKIIEILSKFGLITNVVVDPDKYKSVDDLINKGVVTVPGAKEKIVEILESDGLETIVVKPEPTPIDEVINDEPITITDTPEDVTPIDETPESPEVIDETPVEEAPIDETPVEEPTVTETVEEVAEITETAEETTPKKKRTTKKTE